MFEKQDVSVNMYSHFNIEKNLEEKCINLNDYLRMPSYITISRKSLEEITDFFEELTTKSNNPEANNKILNSVAFLIHNGEYNLYDNVFKARYRSSSNFGLDLLITENKDNFEINKYYIFKNANRKEQETIQIYYKNEKTLFVITKRESEKCLNCEDQPYCLKTRYSTENFFIKEGIELYKETVDKRDEFLIDSDKNLYKDEKTSFSNYFEKSIYHRIPDGNYLVKEYVYVKEYDYPDQKLKREIKSVLLIRNNSKEKLIDGNGSCFPKILLKDVLNGNITPNEVENIINIRDYEKQVEEALKLLNKKHEEEIDRTFEKEEEQNK